MNHSTVCTSTTDGLTGLPRWHPDAPRQGASLAVVDLAHFGARVNERFGHITGDRVIREAARRLADGLAPWRVFRSGGEEFTVEVPGRLDRASAERLAARVAAILAAPFEATGEGQEATVGISLRAVDGDPRPVWAEAMRGADTEAPRRGLRCWIADGPE